MSPRSAEVAYLKRLIKDFPADFPRALDLITARYQVLEQSYRSLFLAKGDNDQPESERIATIKFKIVALHRYLFSGILSHAGEFRKTSDPKGGYIGFGGTKHQRQQSKFKGTKPPNIEQELDRALAHLDYKAKNPIENTLRFYQHFVFIHPFYDANGRLGRVMVSTFLHRFDYYVRWGDFDGSNNTKFINKLNKCHKRMESGFRFEEYFGYLLDFFSKYVISTDELSDFK